jgi:hypothetical protein
MTARQGGSSLQAVARLLLFVAQTERRNSATALPSSPTSSRTRRSSDRFRPPGFAGLARKKAFAGDAACSGRLRCIVFALNGWEVALLGVGHQKGIPSSVSVGPTVSPLPWTGARGRRNRRDSVAAGSRCSRGPWRPRPSRDRRCRSKRGGRPRCRRRRGYRSPSSASRLGIRFLKAVRGHCP